MNHTVDFKISEKAQPVFCDIEHKATLGLMVSSTGKMAPPVILYNQRCSEQLVIKGYDKALVICNQLGEDHAEIVMSKVMPHLMKYLEKNSVLVYDEPVRGLCFRIRDLLSVIKVGSQRIPVISTKIISPIEVDLQAYIKSTIRGYYVHYCIDNEKNLNNNETLAQLNTVFLVEACSLPYFGPRGNQTSMGNTVIK